MSINDTTSLAELKIWMEQRLGAGDQVTCPCCSQKAQVHPWAFNKKMAYALYGLYLKDREEPGGAVHLYKDIVNPNPERTNRSAGQLHHWGLMERAGDVQRPDEPSDGLWRITERGRQFLLGRLRIAKLVKIYDGTLVGQSEQTVSFSEACGVPFTYAQVSRGAPLP